MMTDYARLKIDTIRIIFFYGCKEVGSEEWTETADERLCRVPAVQGCASTA